MSVQNFTSSLAMWASNPFLATLLNNNQHATSASANLAHFVRDPDRRYRPGPN
jgi:hypothetical protein